jgi:hypothetical protein
LPWIALPVPVVAVFLPTICACQGVGEDQGDNDEQDGFRGALRQSRQKSLNRVGDNSV